MDMILKQEITNALNWRYAVKNFDPNKSISLDDLNTIIESGRLSPSSFGVEPWKFIIVENKEIRTKLRAVSFDQPKITDASHVIVIARRTDIRENITKELIARLSITHNQPAENYNGLKQMLEGMLSTKTDNEVDAWAMAQCYIPLGTMIETAALLGIDTCPMEGFNSMEVDALLGLKEKNLSATTILTVGYRGNDPAAGQKKVRRTFDEVTVFIK